jgi:hypothetical protein
MRFFIPSLFRSQKTVLIDGALALVKYLYSVHHYFTISIFYGNFQRSQRHRKSGCFIEQNSGMGFAMSNKPSLEGGPPECLGRLQFLDFSGERIRE